MNNSGLREIIRDIKNIDFLGIVATIVVAWGLVVVIQFVLYWLAARLPTRFRFHILPLAPIIRLLILSLALFHIFPLIINSTPENIIAILGAGGLAIGFAFKDYVSSLIAGIVAIYERPYRLGDWVAIDGYYGEVKSVGMRALQLVTPDDTTVTIPHAKIWSDSVANANDGQREHMCVADFYVHPQHDAQQVRQKLWEVGMTSPYTRLSRPVVVIVQEKPWGTHYRLKAYPIDGRDEFQYISDLTVRGKAALARLDVQPALAPPAITM
ncbi:MAG: mechanosensitive ion channel [Caldilineaceae bacterium]